MSSTRRVEPGAQRRQNGWASAPEYDVLRGLNGTAVAFKAALQDSPAKRELLFLLQALSLREGGTKRIARELVEMFPERIGTPTMHAIGCKPGKRLTLEQCEKIESELYGGSSRDFDVWDDIVDGKSGRRDTKALPANPPPDAADCFCAESRIQCESILHVFIEELCCDPKLELAGQRSPDRNYRGIVETVLEDARYNLERNPKMGRERPDLAAAVEDRNSFRLAQLECFRDVLGALFEFQRRYTDRAHTDFVETSIGKIVFEAMDYVLETGRSALIEGHSGYGKTTALKAWCDMHLGQARYVQLTGITSRTSFFRKLAKALGVASGGGMSSGKIQARVEEFLQRTKLVLAIDEAQYLWPQGKRIESHPELINWLNTACYNEGVPFALSATKQFTLRRQLIERQTDWSSEQARRRIRKAIPRPESPNTEDLVAVARKQLGDLGEGAVDFVVGYALTSRGFFQTITDAIEDAQLIAKRAGRDRITVKDLKTAVYDWRAPSDAALQRVFDSKPESRRRNVRQVVPVEAPESSPDNEPLSPVSRGLQPGRGGFEIVPRSVRPEAVPVPVG